MMNKWTQFLSVNLFLLIISIITGMIAALILSVEGPVLATAMFGIGSSVFLTAFLWRECQDSKKNGNNAQASLDMAIADTNLRRYNVMRGIPEQVLATKVANGAQFLSIVAGSAGILRNFALTQSRDSGWNSNAVQSSLIVAQGTTTCAAYGVMILLGNRQSKLMQEANRIMRKEFVHSEMAEVEKSSDEVNLPAVGDLASDDGALQGTSNTDESPTENPQRVRLS